MERELTPLDIYCLAATVRQCEHELLRLAALEGAAEEAIASASLDGIILSWNAAAERIFGYSRTEAQGQSIDIIIPEHRMQDKTELLERVKGGQRIEHVKTEACRKDKSVIPIDLSVLPIRDAIGAMVGTCAIVKDLSAESRLTDQMLEANKLASIGQLAAGIAHEIKSPLAYILTNISTIERYFGDISHLVRESRAAVDRLASGDDVERVRRELERLREELDIDAVLQDLPQAIRSSKEGAHRIRDTVRNVQDFAFIGKQDLQSVSMTTLLEDAIRLCANEYKHRVAITRRYGDAPSVVCYPQRIVQVFINLLINAAQAIPGKGEVCVSLSRDRDHVRVQIRDTGVGIPGEHLAQIFRPFFTTKPVGQGMGLGLHVAYRIVEAHRGTIDVRSEVGRGTEFTIRLPIQGPRARSNS